MSDPEDIPGRKTPPRAQPIQPDKPGSGNTSEAGESDASPQGHGGAVSPGDPSARREGERARGAIENVREGYGGSSKDIGVDDNSMVPGRPASDAQ